MLQPTFLGGEAPPKITLQNTQAPSEFLTQLRVRLRTFDTSAQKSRMQNTQAPLRVLDTPSAWSHLKVR